MAPVLIKEITRRVNRRGIFQAIYTSGTNLPRPVSTCRYWHRPLNPVKLVECRFSSLRQNMTIPRMVKLYKLPNEYPPLPDQGKFKPLESNYVKRAYDKLCKSLDKYKIHQKFTLAEFKHWFLPKERIIYSYIVVNNKDEVTDMCSFYSLPSTVFGCTRYNELMAAYCFYNFNTVTPLETLMQCTLIAARDAGYDVFNALDLMANKDFLSNLKFGGGDGNLRYYFYNWLCPVVKPEEVSFPFLIMIISSQIALILQ
ncbi:Glycylpeptide N-tetradecanoyltransferase 2 [Cichlidogyrus casuarinus]|uniref:Glycylpeptide N-tetradecanoyltransferase n=1 Tax=Cichlidogyrus casuarinus TaxID=1844966 RepID=A0ABD2QN77_9PLAT